MEPDEYRRMATAGDRHWWYRSTRLLLQELAGSELDRAFAATAPVLDAGGGTGAAGGWMAGRGPTVLADQDVFALGYAVGQHPGYLPVRADLNHLPFAPGSCAAVVCVTALCHRMNPDPAAIVAAFARITVPGGVVVLLEPCGPSLRRGHDEVTHTARRFTVDGLATLCGDAGLDVVSSTAAYGFLVPPAWLLSRFERGDARSDLGRNGSGLFGLFGLLASLERRWLRSHVLSHGLSAVVVARRPG